MAIPPVATAVRHVSDAVTLLAERSPGIRLPGAHSIKGARVRAPRAAPIPAADALEGVVNPKSFSLSAEDAPIPAAAPLPADLLPEAFTALPQAIAGSETASAGSSGAPGFGGNGIVPIGGGGGGGGVPPFVSPNTPPTPPAPPPVPSPVPEPTAWAMLLAGAGLIGGMLRRRRRSYRRARA